MSGASGPFPLEKEEKDKKKGQRCFVLLLDLEAL